MHRRFNHACFLIAALGLAAPATLGSAVQPAAPGERAPRRDAQRPSIVVSGEGEAKGTPDRATVSLGAAAIESTAAAAQEKVNRAVQQALAKLTAMGIPATDITTADLSLMPMYRQFTGREGEDATPEITGYRASNTVRVEVNDIARIGAVIDAGVQAGANELQGVEFSLKDDANQRSEALGEAVRKARQKAEAIARALGVGLGDVQEVYESGVNVFPPPMPMYRMGGVADAMTATPVQPGQVRVNASVTIRYEIAGR